jgi:nucleoside phosphorylase
VTEPERPALLILSALQGELVKALPALGPAVGEVETPKPSRVRRYAIGGREVLAGWTGIGRKATEATLTAISPAPRAILHVGCAGGLAGDLRAGDAVLCERAEADGRSLSCAPPQALADLLAIERRGGCVTVSAVASSPDEKRVLALQHQDACVVEMETFWAASVARRLRVPIACVRVVCDGRDDELPDLSKALDAVGNPRPLGLLKHFAGNPSALAKLPGLASAFARAQATIATLVARVVEGDFASS